MSEYRAINIRVDPALHRSLKRAAVEFDTSITKIVINAILKQLKELEEKKKKDVYV